MAATAAAPTQAQLLQQDAMLAAALLQNATEYYIQGPAVSGALGDTLNIPMPNSGIMLSADLEISIPIDITAVATANPIGAPGAVTNVTVTDWYGNTRTSVSASRLQSLLGYRMGRPFNRIPTSLNNDSADFIGQQLPTAVANSTVRFMLHVPIAQGAGSLVGALLTQTSNGTCSINLQTLANLISATNPHAPYSAGTATYGNVTVTPSFRFLMPVTFAPQTLPLLSLSTAYAIQEVRNQEALVVGAQNYTNFPPARTVYSQILDYVNGNQTNFGSDLTSVAVIVSGATPLKFWTPRRRLIEQRNLLGADDIPGRYYFPFRSRPINTSIYGSFQLQVTPSLVNAGAYLAIASEMTYPMGQPLPGLAA